jgi:hypothetical protein
MDSIRRVSPFLARAAGTGRLFGNAKTIHAEKEILRRMEQGQNRAAPIRDASPQRQAPAFDHCASVRRRADPDLPRSSAGLRSVGRSTALQSVSEGADQLGYVVEDLRRSLEKTIVF